MGAGTPDSICLLRVRVVCRSRPCDIHAQSLYGAAFASSTSRPNHVRSLQGVSSPSNRPYVLSSQINKVYVVKNNNFADTTARVF